MVWPTSDIVTTDVDSGIDSSRSARSAILSAVDNFNSIRSHVSSVSQSLIDDVSAATMTAQLGLQYPDGYVSIPCVLARGPVIAFGNTSSFTTVFSRQITGGLLTSNKLMRFTGLFTDISSPGNGDISQIVVEAYYGSAQVCYWLNTTIVTSGFYNTRSWRTVIELVPKNSAGELSSHVIWGGDRGNYPQSHGINPSPAFITPITASQFIPSLVVDTTTSQLFFVRIRRTESSSRFSFVSKCSVLEVV